MLLRYGSVDDGVMEFSNPAIPVVSQEEATGLVAAS